MQTSANYKKRIWYKRETGRISSASWGEYESASWGCGVSRQHCRQAHYWMPNPHGWSGWTTPVSHPSPLSRPPPPQTSRILSMHTPVNVPRPMPHVRTKASKWPKINLEQEKEEEEWTLTNPVRRSKLRCKFFTCPNSPKALCRSSSCASSWTPVTSTIHPSIATPTF